LRSPIKNSFFPKKGRSSAGSGRSFVGGGGPEERRGEVEGKREEKNGVSGKTENIILEWWSAPKDTPKNLGPIGKKFSKGGGEDALRMALFYRGSQTKKREG